MRGKPADARRTTAISLKNRRSKAKVLKIEDIAGEECQYGISIWDDIFVYKVDEMVYPDYRYFDGNLKNPCGRGIHFFLNKEDASNYSLYY